MSVINACVAEAFESAPQPAAVVTPDKRAMETLRGISETPDVRVIGVYSFAVPDESIGHVTP